MKFGTRLVVVALLVLLLPVAARSEEPKTSITFFKELPKAVDAAKLAGKPLMICINSKRVDGKFRLEPAARELRDKTYRAPEIVKLADKFVCAFITGDSTSEDFGELRMRYKIDGDIVSPQHIFAYPNGKLIFREEFWPYGTGASSVKALLGLMNKALDRDKTRREALPPGEGEKSDGSEEEEDGETTIRPVPEDPVAREAWIQELFLLAKSPLDDKRRPALQALIDADKDGDIVKRMVVLMEEVEKDVLILVDFVRAFGRPKLEAAREGVEDHLSHKEDMLRANAAVSLEYIGSEESISPLIRAMKREKDEAIVNHMCRALGRCGAGEGKVRGILLKKAQGGKSSFGTYGAIIGLAYFEKDKRTSREVEKLVKKFGASSGGRRGWRGSGKRYLAAWSLAEIRQPKSAKFVRDTMIPLIGESRWSTRIIAFYEAVASYIEGSDDAMGEVEGGVVRVLSGGGGRGGGTTRRQLQDEARMDRENVGFQPKGEFQGGGG